MKISTNHQIHYSTCTCTDHIIIKHMCNKKYEYFTLLYMIYTVFLYLNCLRAIILLVLKVLLKHTPAEVNVLNGKICTPLFRVHSSYHQRTPSVYASGYALSVTRLFSNQYHFLTFCTNRQSRFQFFESSFQLLLPIAVKT